MTVGGLDDCSHSLIMFFDVLSCKITQISRHERAFQEEFSISIEILNKNLCFIVLSFSMIS